MSNRIKTWKVLDYGKVPEDPARHTLVEIECVCGNEAYLPVSGRPIASKGHGVIFDDDGSLPERVQCRHCARILSLSDDDPSSADSTPPEATPHVR